MVQQDSLIRIVETSARKTASARRRNGVIHVNVPRRWSSSYQQEVAEILVKRVLRREALEQRRLAQCLTEDVKRLTLSTVAEVRAYVEAVNAQTFNVPVQGVRVGRARHTRLAMVNLCTGIITISRYCLQDVPEPALRYLVIHELAHFHERSHNARFWRLVAQYVPDYKRQIAIITAAHTRAVEAETHAQSASPLNVGVDIGGELSADCLRHA